MMPTQPMSHVGRQMQNRKFGLYLLRTFIAALATIITTSVVAAQVADRPWMNPKLSPEERADMVLKQLTLDEKLALVHGNGMAHASQWQMPLTHLANGGAGYVEGVKRLGIPPLLISDAGYGVRDSGANGKYSTAMPSSLGAAASWDQDSACEFGTVIGQELRAQGFNMTLGGMAKDGTITNWIGAETGLCRFIYPFRLEYWDQNNGVQAPDGILRTSGKTFITAPTGVAVLSPDQSRWNLRPGTEELNGTSCLSAGPDETIFSTSPRGLAQIRSDGTIVARTGYADGGWLSR